ncbi:MAG: PKD domain-containing protein [Bacteroidota bacterium]
MKSKNLISMTIRFAVCVILITSIFMACQKETIQTGDTTLDLIETADFRSNNPLFNEIRLRQGLLDFPSQDYFDAAIDELIALEEELATYVSDRYSGTEEEFPYYQATYDPEGPFEATNPITGERLSALEDSDIPYFEEDPIGWLFESATGLESIRKKLQNIERDMEEQGTYNPDENDPDDFFIYDDKLRTVLNTGLEIKVGTSIYKYASSTALIEIADGSFDLLTELRGVFAVEIAWQEEPILPTTGMVQAHPLVLQHQMIQVHKVDDILDVQACAADFTVSPHPILPQTFNFTNTSTGSYTSLIWDFGDGGSSTSNNPTYTYSNLGTYNVTLTLYDGVNTCDAEVTSFTIAADCNPCFTFNVNQGQVSFTDCSQSYSGGTVTDYIWDFGDTNSQQGAIANPSHTYAANGTYTVCLTITTDDGCIEQFCDDVLINMECCRTNKKNKHDNVVNIGSNRGLKGKVWITSIPFYRRWGAKTKAYRNPSNWKKTKADYIFAGVGGIVWSSNCTVQNVTSLVEDETDKKKVSVTSPGAGQSIDVRLNGLGGTFIVQDNGANATATLSILTPDHCD